MIHIIMIEISECIIKFNTLYCYIFQILQMIESYIKNAVEYPLQELKCISGSIPKNIQGRYIRNGAGTFRYGNDVLSHLFTGGMEAS